MKKSMYPEIEEIREDLDSLKTNVIELTKHVTSDGDVHAQELKDYAMKRIGKLQSSGRQQYKNLERRIKAKPGQSLAIAFAVGLVASQFLGRR